MHWNDGGEIRCNVWLKYTYDLIHITMQVALNSVIASAEHMRLLASTYQGLLLVMLNRSGLSQTLVERHACV